MDLKSVITNEKNQAMPAGTVPLGPEAFTPRADTAVTWLGGAGILLNARGTCVMIDPVLEGFDMPVLFDAPVAPANVPALEAVLITHIDNDHFSRSTCHDIAGVCPAYHAPHYVAEVAREEGLPGVGHGIGESFSVGSVTARLTPAWHTWQNESSKWAWRTWAREDYCGYWLDTPDGSIWLPGDSRLLPGLLRQRVAHHLRRGGAPRQHLPERAAAVHPLGHSRRPGLVDLQRRPTRARRARGQSGSRARSAARRAGRPVGRGWEPRALLGIVQDDARTYECGHRVRPVLAVLTNKCGQTLGVSSQVRASSAL